MIVVAGSLNQDFVGRAPRIPAPGETVLGAELLHFHGGKGGNQATAAARLGARVLFVGAVGDDAGGRELMRALDDEGIDTRRVAVVPGASGAALITVSDAGENAITVLPGANRAVPSPAEAWPAGARVLLLQLEIPMAVNLTWAALARDAGAAVVLNAAPHAPLPSPLTAGLDTLIVNRDELRALTGEVDVVKGLHAAMASGPRRVVATLGAQGCMALEGAQLHRVPSHEVRVMDSTGAGDAFAGAYAVARAQEQPLAAALVFANAAAALACTRSGAREGMPRRADVMALLGTA